MTLTHVVHLYSCWSGLHEVDGMNLFLWTNGDLNLYTAVGFLHVIILSTHKHHVILPKPIVQTPAAWKWRAFFTPTLAFQTTTAYNVLTGECEMRNWGATNRHSVKLCRRSGNRVVVCFNHRASVSLKALKQRRHTTITAKILRGHFGTNWKQQTERENHPHVDVQLLNPLSNPGKTDHRERAKHQSFFCPNHLLFPLGEQDSQDQNNFSEH